MRDMAVTLTINIKLCTQIPSFLWTKEEGKKSTQTLKMNNKQIKQQKGNDKMRTEKKAKKHW